MHNLFAILSRSLAIANGMVFRAFFSAFFSVELFTAPPFSGHIAQARWWEVCRTFPSFARFKATNRISTYAFFRHQHTHMPYATNYFPGRAPFEPLYTIYSYTYFFFRFVSANKFTIVISDFNEKWAEQDGFWNAAANKFINIVELRRSGIRCLRTLSATARLIFANVLPRYGQYISITACPLLNEWTRKNTYISHNHIKAFDIIPKRKSKP